MLLSVCSVLHKNALTKTIKQKENNLNRTMKKLLFAGAMALSMFTATAQNKLGYINANELISVMPEAAKAQKDLQELQASLSQTYQELTIEFNGLDSAFATDSSKLTPTMREIKRKDLISKFQTLQGFQQNSQEQMQAAQEKALGPIREKAFGAIKAVASEKGYSYVFNEENLLVAPQGDNILPFVKAKLGIKDPAPKPSSPAKPAAGK
jgi:outer membrane protein